MHSLERRSQVEGFRKRLGIAMERAGSNRSQLAKMAGIDRSTLSQLLAPDNDRLPRSSTLVAIASKLQVSLDWLLGLSDEARLGAEILSDCMQVTPSSHLPCDVSVLEWQREAMGYKTRYLPSSLPDLVMTETVLNHEYANYESVNVEKAAESINTRRQQAKLPGAELEICLPMQQIEGFAYGEGNWRGLGTNERREQLQAMALLFDELYPKIRCYLFDATEYYASAYTVYGHQRAAIYLGQLYFVFNTTEHIQTLSQHFDGLIRSAKVHAHEMPDFINELKYKVG